MGLIDADKLIEDIHKRSYISKGLSEIFETIIDEQPLAFSMGTKPIDNFVDPFDSRTTTENNLVEENAEQLTVNDIDKVVKQLEEDCKILKLGNDGYSVVALHIEEALKILKAGGDS